MLKRKRLNYTVRTESCSFEIFGYYGFEMFGHKFGIHKEITHGKWGDYDLWVVDDISTGRSVGHAFDFDEAIKNAKERLISKGEKEYIKAIDLFK